MKTVMTSVVLGLGLALVGCSSGGDTASAGSRGGSTTISRSGSSRVDRAVAITKAVQANPGRAEDVLRQNGMTVEQYEDLMYDIAADPAMSEEFNDRMGG
jgi:hypothetical protein